MPGLESSLWKSPVSAHVAVKNPDFKDIFVFAPSIELQFYALKHELTSSN